MSQIQTYTGRIFDYANPRAEDISISDIAHALALQTRYLGHCNRSYSVAQHCCVCSYIAESICRLAEIDDAALRLHCLLHDAAEAYLGDLPSPLKTLLPDYMKFEEKISELIYQKFGVDQVVNKDLVKRIDNTVLVHELPIHRGSDLADFWDKYKYKENLVVVNFDIAYDLVPWSAEFAESEFIDQFNMLNEKQAQHPRQEGAHK